MKKIHKYGALAVTTVFALSGATHAIANAQPEEQPHYIDGVFVDVKDSNFKSYADIEEFFGKNDHTSHPVTATIDSSNKITKIVDSLNDGDDTEWINRENCAGMAACWLNHRVQDHAIGFSDEGVNVGPFEHRSDFCPYSMNAIVYYTFPNGQGNRHDIGAGGRLAFEGDDVRGDRVDLFAGPIHW